MALCEITEWVAGEKPNRYKQWLTLSQMVQECAHPNKSVMILRWGRRENE